MTRAKIIDLILRAVCLAVGLSLFFWWSNRQVEKRVKAECELKAVQQVVITTEAKQKEVEDVAKAKAIILKCHFLSLRGQISKMTLFKG